MSDDVDERAESFIPYKQFKPLLRKGMTFLELRDAVCARAGLDPARYHLKTRAHAHGTPLQSALTAGVWIISLEQSRALRSVYGGYAVVAP